MSNLSAVIPDANVVIALCAKEKDKLLTAETAFKNYLNNGYEFFSPSVLVAEVIFILCQKLADGSLTKPEYEKAVKAFEYYLSFIALRRTVKPVWLNVRLKSVKVTDVVVLPTHFIFHSPKN